MTRRTKIIPRKPLATRKNTTSSAPLAHAHAWCCKWIVETRDISDISRTQITKQNTHPPKWAARVTATTVTQTEARHLQTQMSTSDATYHQHGDGDRHMGGLHACVYLEPRCCVLCCCFAQTAVSRPPVCVVWCCLFIVSCVVHTRETPVGIEHDSVIDERESCVACVGVRLDSPTQGSTVSDH